MKKKLFLSISILVPFLIICYYYQYYNINDSIGIQCSFFQITGLDCPGCGGQRAFYYLLHGELYKALRYNFLIIFLLPLISFIYFSLIQFYLFKNSKYINSKLFDRKLGYILIILLLVFFAIRNIPFEPFIYLKA